ncbi:hypothetical protein [Amycolatopsis sp. NPDC003676]
MTADPDTYPQPTPDPPPSRAKLFLWIGATVVLAGALAAVLIAVFGASTGPLNGTLSLRCDMQCIKSTADGYDGYRDISDGAQVTLVDETGRVVATTALHRSGGPTDIVDGVWVRAFTFEFTDVPNAERYGVHFGNDSRGTIWKDADDAERNGWQLSLGD